MLHSHVKYTDSYLNEGVGAGLVDLSQLLVFGIRMQRAAVRWCCKSFHCGDGVDSIDGGERCISKDGTMHDFPELPRRNEPAQHTVSIYVLNE